MTFFDEVKYRVAVYKNECDIPSGAYLVQTMYPESMLYDKPLLINPVANYVPTFKSRNEIDTCCTRCKIEYPIQECDFYRSLFDQEFRKDQKVRPVFPPAVKPFDCLATSSNGDRLLGVLKADVDNLGMIFSEGIPKGSRSLSRIASLSRMLDLFFCGWIDHTLRTHTLRTEKKFHDNIYTVYSGGDDLLLVGPWDAISELSVQIAEAFRSFVAENPQVTISAGIAVKKPKFPIAKSSGLADDFLVEAKNGEIVNDIERRKNRLHLFGATAAWFKKRSEDVEVTKLMEWSKKLSDALETKEPDKKLSSGVVYSLLELSGMCEKWVKDKNIESLRFLSQMAYMIERNIKDKQIKDSTLTIIFVFFMVGNLFTLPKVLE